MTLRYSMAAFAALACVGLGGNNASASTVCLNATHGATELWARYVVRDERGRKRGAFCRARRIP